MTKLKNRRLASGMSQRELAEKSGVGIRMVQHYEQGQKSIDRAQVGIVLRLAAALGCSLADLLEEADLVSLALDYDRHRCRN